MNIWHLDPANLTPYYNIAVCEALALDGHDVTYTTSQYLYEDLTYPTTIEVHELYFLKQLEKVFRNSRFIRQITRGLSYPFYHWVFLNRVKRQRPDIVHIQWSRLPIFDLWLIKQIQALGIPVVHTIHDVIPLFSPNQTSSLEKVFAQADALILHAEINRRNFLSIYSSVSVERLHVIPMITNAIILPVDASQQSARAALHLPSDGAVFVFFGSIKHYKGLDLLASALQHALNTDENIYIVIAGKSETDEDRAILAELRKHPHVHIVDQYVPHEDVWKYHLAADVLLFPYHAIYQSAALITALAFGRAVIVTDVGALPETISGNGWVVPAEDAHAFGNAMLEAAADLPLTAKMGETSSQIIEHKHSGRAIAEAHIKVYEEIIREFRTGSSSRSHGL